MNHQPFEKWLLTDDTLSPEEARSLREHLLVCPQCQGLHSSWYGVKQLMREAPAVKPANGFTMRFQERLAEENRRSQRRQTLILLIFNGGMAFFLFLFLAMQVWELLRSPGHLLVILGFRLMSLFQMANEAGELLTMLFGAFLNIAPPVVWPFIAGLSSMLVVLWIVAFKQLTVPRRITL
jgi:anti-sigma factor RsiW